MNIKSHRDRLDTLLARYEQEIRETEEQLRALQSNCGKLNVPPPQPTRLDNAPAEPEKVRDTGITKTVIDSLNYLWPQRKDSAAVTEIKPVAVGARI